MKKLKNISSLKSLDFAAIKLLLSIIAISFAGIVSEASTKGIDLVLDKSISPTIIRDLKSNCLAPYSTNYCGKDRGNSCQLETLSFHKVLNLPFLTSYNRPQCTSVGPSKVSSQSDS